MAEYIDRQEAKKGIANWLREDRNWHPYSKGKNIPTGEVFDILCRIPAADVQPVKHGSWIEYPECLRYENAFSSDHIVCSCCEAVFNVLDNCTECFVCCPNCGAKMDGEA